MSLAAENGRFAGALVAGLVGNGVTDAVLSPGSRSTPLALALADHPALRVHVLVDERAAGFVALGLARATGRAVVLLCTSGTAGAHWLPALAEAALSAIPLIALTADRPDELQACGAPQTIDQERLFGPHARWLGRLSPSPGAPAGWPAAMAARAVDAAQGPPAGPVHLNVAFREPLWEPGLAPPPPVRAPRVLRGRARLDRDAAREALELLDSPRGAIVAGPRAVAGEEEAAAVALLAARLGWPILADPLSGLRFGPHGEAVVASVDAIARDPEWSRALRPEACLRLGQVVTSEAVRAWLAAAAPRTVLVDPDGQWHDPTWAASLLLVAPAGEACRALAAEATGALDPGWAEAWRAADERARASIAAACADGWWEGAVARALVEALPAGALLHVASSLPVRDLDAFGGASATPLAVVSNRGANGIDGTVASAAGAALGWSRGPVAVLLGDLACVHDLGGLAAASELGVRLLVVVADNGGGGIFGQLPIAAHPRAFEQLFLTPSQLDLEAAARGLGARASSVDDRPALLRELAAALDDPTPAVRVVRAAIPRTESARRRQAARSIPQEAPCPATIP